MKNIAAALVKAQKEFGPAIRNAENGGFRGKKYADLTSCLDAVMDALNNNGIALIQSPLDCADGALVETLFVHESGEMLSAGKMHVPASKHDAHGYGSSLTYARRYGLMAACGIAPEDDDGNAATKAAPKHPEVDAPDDEDHAIAKEYAESVVGYYTQGKEAEAFREDAVVRTKGNEFYLLYWGYLKPHSAVRSALKKNFEATQKATTA